MTLKKNICLVSFLLYSQNFLFAGCGGCVDAPNANAQANIIINNYYNLDKQLEDKIKKLNSDLKQTLDLEKDIEKLYSKNIILYKESVLIRIKNAKLIDDIKDKRSENTN